MSDIKIDEVKSIIQYSGGKVVGRTRLQKIGYLFSATGLDTAFRFSYKHYGPFSEQLATSAKAGVLFGELKERQDQTSWGGTYSTYTIDDIPHFCPNDPRLAIASKAVAADSIELELAATAVFLAKEGYSDPWDETTNRKPEKATSVRLANAKSLLADIAEVGVPDPVPKVLFD